MVDAVIMARTEAGTAIDLLPSIEALEGVVEAHVVAGDYDVVVEAAGEDPSEILQKVASGLRGLEGITETRTYVAIG